MFAEEDCKSHFLRKLFNKIYAADSLFGSHTGCGFIKYEKFRASPKSHCYFQNLPVTVRKGATHIPCLFLKTNTLENPVRLFYDKFSGRSKEVPCLPFSRQDRNLDVLKDG